MKQFAQQTISVVAAVIKHEGLVLAAKRRSGGISGGMWEFPGGKIEPGESPREALAREILEELGLEIHVSEEIGTYVTDLASITIALQSFWCEWLGGSLVLNEHDEIRWCSPNEIEELEWALPDIPVVQKVLESLSIDSPACIRRKTT